MKRLGMMFALLCMACPAFAQKVTSVSGAIVGNTQHTPRITYRVQFNSSIGATPGVGSVALDSTKFALVTGSGQQVFASHVMATLAANSLVSLVFDVGPENFGVFEGLEGSDDSAYLINLADMPFGSTTYAKGQLEADTKGQLAPIPDTVWNRYVVNGYSSNYLFPQEFKVGTDLGQEDSNKINYYLQVQQSRPWVATTSSLSFFWGVQGRWSTLANDPFNFAKLYPAVLQYDLTFSRLSLLAGVEVGSGGFGKNGRGTGMLNYEFRFPWNLVDLTFGSPRAQIHPLIDISGQFSKAWGDSTLPDSMAQGFDVNGSIRYNIPVLDNYLLQTNASVNWSYQTKDLHYLYDLSLGYVSNGNVRIMLEYKQGYEKVTQIFDKQLLLGFAFDALNKLVPN